MNAEKGVLFDQALALAVENVKAVVAGLGNELTLIRDLRGRIRVLLPGNRKDFSEGTRATLIDVLTYELQDSLGAYGFPSERMVLFSGDLVHGEQISASSDRRLLSDERGCRIWLLDRQITGQDWLRPPFDRKTKTPRLVFYGIKGGVGRSTAAIIYACHLAKQGKKVLLFDLDLESPGISSTLLPLEQLPDYGIVDWFVEDGVGQGSIIEKEMTALSTLTQDFSGEIRIVPAFGRKTGDYLAKLGRCYAEFANSADASWGGRLERLVALMESAGKPDVVILDSRSGMHDIAAVAVTRMDAEALLFAVDNVQTWRAYSFLFRHWQQHPQLTKIRNRLHLVAAMVPETGRDAYLQGFQKHAWDVFRDHVYDDAAPFAAETFNFVLDDEDAPHYPLPIFRHRALQEFNPNDTKTRLDEKIVEEALGLFIDGIRGKVVSW